MKKKIEFSRQEKQVLAGRIQRYFERELDQEIGTLPAELLLDFMAGEIGNFYYNHGLRDAHNALQARMEELADVVYELEKPVDLKR